MPHSIPDPLIMAAQRRPYDLALVSATVSLSFSQYNSRVWSCLTRLGKLGVERGDRVGILLKPSCEFVILLMALFRMGAVACPLNIRIPIQEMSRQLLKTSCRFVVADSEWNSDVSVISPKECFEEVPGSFSEQATISLSQEATVLFTSGSSSRPKAAVHSYGNHYYSAMGSNANIPLSPNDRWVLSLPLYHVGGLAILFRCLFAHAAVLIPEAEDKHFVDAIQTFNPTHISLVSTQLRRLLHADMPVSKCVLLGGSAIEESLIRDAYSRGWPLYKSYGMTEMSSQVTATAPDSDLRYLFSSGKPLKYREVCISNDGEVLLKGATLFQGYLGHHNSSEEWYHTGDLGSLDGEGYLHINGRKDNLFISGGENIQAEEIERVLQEMDGVLRALVVPREDEEFGFRPVAFIDGEHWNVEELRSRAEKSLPRYKIPVEFYSWPKSENESLLKINREDFLSKIQK